jgi:hypothetical protein
MKQFAKVAVPVVAIVLAVMAGTAAYAMRGGDSHDDPPAATAEDSAGGDGRNAGAFAAVCAEEQPACDDTIECADALGCGVAGGCTPEECMVDTLPVPAPYCPPGSVCIEPWLMDPPACPAEVPIEECAALANESGRFDCAIAESDPPQLVCKRIDCLPVEPMPLPVDIMPLPADDPAVSGPGDQPLILQEGDIQEPPPDVVIDPMPVDPCVPIDPCADGVPGPAETCVAPDCPVNSDGALDCGDPCADDIPDPTTTCLPPDCAVSSDGAIACPEPRPLPDNCEQFPDGSVACAGSEGCAVPEGQPVDLPCLPPNCRIVGGDAVACEEEAVPPSGAGGGTSGSSGGAVE